MLTSLTLYVYNSLLVILDVGDLKINLDVENVRKLKLEQSSIIYSIYIILLY